MPQVFQVLCCYKCEMFQVHQVKKSNKWQCRVCNEKQSLKKAFKIGSSRDCRFLVQKLNLEKSGQVQEENEDLESCRSDNDLFESENTNVSFELLDCTEKENMPSSFVEGDETTNSKWSEDNSSSYFDIISKTSEENTVSYENDFLREDTKLLEVSQPASDCEDEFFQKGKNISNQQMVCGQSAPVNMHKRYLESQAKDVTSPPLKKNRGFQLILKAASKFN